MKEISITLTDMPDGGVKAVFSDDIDTEIKSPAHTLAATLHVLLTQLLEEKNAKEETTKGV